MKLMKIENIVEEAITRAGGCKQLADDMQVDPSVISRFRSGEGGMTMAKLNRLLDVAGMALVGQRDHKDMVTTLFTVARLYQQSIES